MRNIPEPYNTIVASGDYETETKIRIAGRDYYEDVIVSLSTDFSLFNGNTPTVGGCVSRTLDCTLITESSSIPRMAEVIPYVRVTNGKLTSQWIQKGQFFVDSRVSNVRDGTVTIHAFDKILSLERQYSQTTSQIDRDVVNYIAAQAGISKVDADMNKGYTIPAPDAITSMRTIMGNIAAAYAGNWLITDDGTLRLVKLNTLPTETFRLLARPGVYLTMGGNYIELR